MKMKFQEEVNSGYHTMPVVKKDINKVISFCPEIRT